MTCRKQATKGRLQGEIQFQNCRVGCSLCPKVVTGLFSSPSLGIYAEPSRLLLHIPPIFKRLGEIIGEPEVDLFLRKSGRQTFHSQVVEMEARQPKRLPLPWSRISSELYERVDAA